MSDEMTLEQVAAALESHDGNPLGIFEPAGECACTVRAAIADAAELRAEIEKLKEHRTKLVQQATIHVAEIERLRNPTCPFNGTIHQHLESLLEWNERTPRGDTMGETSKRIIHEALYEARRKIRRCICGD